MFARIQNGKVMELVEALTTTAQEPIFETVTDEETGEEVTRETGEFQTVELQLFNEELEFVEAPEGVQPGYSYENGSFFAPQPANPNAPIMLEIIRKENSVSPRRIREAILGVDDGWMENINAEIEALRAQLV